MSFLKLSVTPKTVIPLFIFRFIVDFGRIAKLPGLHIFTRGKYNYGNCCNKSRGVTNLVSMPTRSHFNMTYITLLKRVGLVWTGFQMYALGPIRGGSFHFFGRGRGPWFKVTPKQIFYRQFRSKQEIYFGPTS